MGIAVWLLSAVWQWLLGKIGMSTDQKLGRAEELAKQQAQTVKEQANELNIESKPDVPFNDAVNKLPE